MATNNYITIDDVTNKTVQQLYQAGSVEIQKYIDQTNDWYEAYAQNLNLLISNIKFPVTQYVIDMLNAQLLVRIGSAFIGGLGNGSTNSNDLYTMLYNLGNEELKKLLPRINAESIEGYQTRQADTVVFGRIVRK